MKTHLKYDTGVLAIYDENGKYIGYYEETGDSMIVFSIKNEDGDDLYFPFSLKSLNILDSDSDERDKCAKYWELMNEYINGLDCEGHNPFEVRAYYNRLIFKYEVVFIYNDPDKVRISEFNLSDLSAQKYIGILNYGKIFKAMEKAYSDAVKEWKDVNE